MVGEGWDWCMCSIMVTTTRVSVVGGVKVDLAFVYFSHQDWVSCNWLGKLTASQPSHSLTISIMNGFASLRFELIIHNHHNTPAFESWVVTISASGTYVSHLRRSMFGLIKEFHTNLTLPTSHHKYNEWLEKVEIGIWALKWSSQHVFQSRVGTNLAWPSSTFHIKIEWVWTDSSNSHQLNPSNVSLWV